MVQLGYPFIWGDTNLPLSLSVGIFVGSTEINMNSGVNHKTASIWLWRENRKPLLIEPLSRLQHVSRGIRLSQMHVLSVVLVNTACAYVLLSRADMANVKVQTMERDSDVFVLNSTLVSGFFFFSFFILFYFFSFKVIPYWTFVGTILMQTKFL